MTNLQTPAILDIPETRVRLEDGSEVLVPAFRVRRRAVTVGEFRAFQQATGYVTTAEQLKDPGTYQHHYAIEDLPAGEVMPCPAYRVSWEDADAYCRWAGGQLPSETQWLAAAVSDWSRTWSEDECVAIQGRMASDPGRMYYEGPEWTCIRAGPDSAVLRRRPLYVLEDGWMTCPYNRKVLPVTCYSDVICFRVCYGPRR